MVNYIFLVNQCKIVKFNFLCQDYLNCAYSKISYEPPCSKDFDTGKKVLVPSEIKYNTIGLKRVWSKYNSFCIITQSKIWICYCSVEFQYNHSNRNMQVQVLFTEKLELEYACHGFLGSPARHSMTIICFFLCSLYFMVYEAFFQ